MLSTLVEGLGPDVNAILVVVLGVWAGTIGLPVPEEIPLLTAGVLAAMGLIPLHVAMLVGFVACFSADLTVFAVGRRIGRGLNSHPYLRRLMRGRYLLRARHMYVHRGRFTMIVARLVPGLKMPFLFTAGALRMPWGRFILRDLGALVLLVPGLVGLAYSSSLTVGQLAGLVRRAAIVGGVVGALLIAIAYLVSSLARQRRRRWRARCVAAGIPVRGEYRGATLPSSWS